MKLTKSHFLFLLILAFIFISTSSLVILKPKLPSEAGKVLSFYTRVETFTPIPILSENASKISVSAQSALAIDLDSGVSLYDKEPDKLILPASTTKIITALVALDYYPREAILNVDGIGVDGQKMDLVQGEEITVDSLLKGLLIASANDAAEVLAHNYPGGREAFVAAMNEKAKELHLENTNFTNPSGLDSFAHISTARDLIRAASLAMKNPYFSEVVATRQMTVTSVDGEIVHQLKNINELVGSVEGVLGVKTGWTENADENLVTYVERNGQKVMIAVLGSQDRFGETKQLIEWIFENYQWKEVSYP